MTQIRKVEIAFNVSYNAWGKKSKTKQNKKTYRITQPKTQNFPARKVNVKK